MKTVKELSDQINSLSRSVNKETSESEAKKIKREVAFLRTCRLYMESSPRKEFIESEIKEVERKLKILPSHYSSWQIGKVLSSYKNPYNSFLNEMGFSHLKDQLKTLKFIYND
jgi:hypothetical protein